MDSTPNRFNQIEFDFLKQRVEQLEKENHAGDCAMSDLTNALKVWQEKTRELQKENAELKESEKQYSDLNQGNQEVILALETKLDASQTALAVAVKALEFYVTAGPAMAAGECIADGGSRASEALSMITPYAVSAGTCGEERNGVNPPGIIIDELSTIKGETDGSP